MAGGAPQRAAVGGQAGAGVGEGRWPALPAGYLDPAASNALNQRSTCPWHDVTAGIARRGLQQSAAIKIDLGAPGRGHVLLSDSKLP